MASTPTRSKAVSFNISTSNSSTSTHLTTTRTPTSTKNTQEAGITKRPLSQLPKPSSPLVVQGKSSPNPQSKPAPVTVDSIPTAQHGAKPDLVADIVDGPKTIHPRKLANQGGGAQANRPDSRPGSDIQAIMQKNQDRQTSPSSRHRQQGGGRMYHRSGVRTFANTTSTRDRSPLLDQQKYKASSMSTSQVAQVAHQIRDSVNSASHEQRRALKYDAARLREHLLKVEEEIKNLNRGRGTLELAIQDVRKSLSVNQQSISTQQKKSSRGEEVHACREREREGEREYLGLTITSLSSLC